jgi:hypothetical protein
MEKKVSTKKAVKKEKVIKTPVIKTEEKKKYLECPFCQTKADKITGRDGTSSWCQKCGRCFPAIWKIEE